MWIRLCDVTTACAAFLAAAREGFATHARAFGRTHIFARARRSSARVARRVVDGRGEKG